MRKEELMVGDLVLFHDSGWESDGKKWHEDRVCRITGIDYNPRLEWTDEDGEREEWPHASYEDIEPIPLTDEILVKNGFTESPHYPKLFRIIEDSQRVSVNMDNGLYLNVIKYFDDGSEEFNFVVPHPKFVHELQNALRILGIDNELFY